MIDIVTKLFNAMHKDSPEDLRDTMKMYPSSASVKLDDGTIVGACARKEYYRAYDCEREGTIDPDSEILFATGDALHDMIVSKFKQQTLNTGLFITSVEQSLYRPKYLTSGRTDFTLIEIETQDVYGVEIKSSGDGAIYTMKGSDGKLKPKLEHLLQCTLYLDEYTKNAIKHSLVPPKGWVLLYISRSENWQLKSKPHGSPFKYLWQFYVQLDDKGYIEVFDQEGSRVSIPKISAKMIDERYDFILNSISNKTIPDREFEYQYSEETFVIKAKLDLTEGGLNKKDSEAVAKWLENGAPQGQLNLDKGDFQCRYCDYSKQCYSATPDQFKKRSRVLLPNSPKADAPATPPREKKDITSTIL